MLRLRAFITSLFIIALSGALSLVAIVTTVLSPGGDLYLWWAQKWSRLIFWFGGIRWQLELSPQMAATAQSQQKPEPSFLFLSNHESLTDILALYATLPFKVVMVAKRSILILPIFSWGMWIAGFVFINRKNREAAYRSMEEAGHKVRRGRSVLVFPEGTRGDGQTLLKFKRGGFVLAQSGQIPIVPVGIHGTYKVLPRDTFPVYPGSIAVCVGDPIPAPPPGAPLEPWMAQVREEVERLRKRAAELVAASKAQ